MIKALSSSLSLRLLGILMVTAVLVVAILIALFSKGLSGQWRRSIEPHLIQYTHYVQQDLGSPPRPARAAAIARRLPINIYIYKNNTLDYSTSRQPLDLEQLDFKPGRMHDKKHPQPVLPGRPQATFSVAASNNRHTRKHVLRSTDGIYTVYYDLNKHKPRGARVSRIADELLYALIALGLVFGSSYLLIRWQLSPIRQIQKSVGIMAGGQLDHRINRQGHGDLDVLSTSIDSMAQKIQAMLDAKRQLLLAISHELRSPVTRARITTELLPESKNRDRLLDDMADMERMITDIMESEQLQAGHSILNREDLSLTQLFKDELARLAPDSTLQFNQVAETINFSGDATRLRIMLRNLVLNALQHGKSDNGDTQLEVSLIATGETITLTVADQGPGIAAEHINEVGDAFYRPDPSRSRATGGFGLGLSLARLIAEAHGGSLDIDSDPKSRPGTRVVISLPC